MVKRLFALLAALFLSTGCYTVTSKMPGVLDLRSDGQDAPVDHSELAQSAKRDGFGGIAFGGGVSGSGDVLIEDRNHYVLLLLPIMNESSSEEWRSALGDGQLRNIAITEGMSGMSVLSYLGKAIIGSCLCGVGPFVAGTWDFKARATRIQAVANVREESIVPPADAPLPAPLPAGSSTSPTAQRF